MDVEHEHLQLAAVSEPDRVIERLGAFARALQRHEQSSELLRWAGVWGDDGDRLGHLGDHLQGGVTARMRAARARSACR